MMETGKKKSGHFWGGPRLQCGVPDIVCADRQRAGRKKRLGLCVHERWCERACDNDYRFPYL